MRISHEAIYQALYVQGRGALRRELVACLRSGRALRFPRARTQGRETELIHHRGPWRHLEQVEFATLEWVDWFNHRRLLEPLGYLPPVEFGQRYYQHHITPAREPVPT